MRSIIIILCISCLIPEVFAQNVGIGISTPDGSAMLDVSSTTKGFLPPRLTQAQRTAISSPAEGLLVFQTDAAAGYYFFTGTGWILLGGEGGSGQMIDMDGNVYPTVRIGGQEWMAENLRVKHYRNGDSIHLETVNSSWGLMTTGAYCWYNNDSITYTKYGVLYNWFAVDDSRNLCPFGWHVASDDEWTALTTYLGGIPVAGGTMKTSISWYTPNTGATNSSGFSGLPGGYRYVDGVFFAFNLYGYWWTSTENTVSNAWNRGLNYEGTNVYLGANLKNFGFSVRCLRDY